MNNNNKKESKKKGRPSGKTNNMCSEWLISKKQGEMDACDCLNQKCPGCWYPCEICGSNKCSAFCRTIKRDGQLEWMISE